MKYAVLLIVTLLINNIHIPFISSSDKIFNFVYDVEQYSLFTFLFAFIFSITPKGRFKERGISLVLMLMFINLTMNTIYDKLDIAFFNIQYPLGIMLFSYFIYTTVNWKKNPEILIEACKTYFVFKKPKKFLDFLITFFRRPVSSFSIVNDDEWYLYTKEIKGLYKTDAVFLDQKYYDVIEVSDIDYSLLENLLGKPWSLRKSNCVTAFAPALKSIGVNLGWFDFIPAVFAYKFSKGRYDI